MDTECAKGKYLQSYTVLALNVCRQFRELKTTIMYLNNISCSICFRLVNRNIISVNDVSPVIFVWRSNSFQGDSNNSYYEYVSLISINLT